jgi:hypothetical protein
MRAITFHLLVYFCLSPFERGGVLIPTGYKNFDGFDQHAYAREAFRNSDAENRPRGGLEVLSGFRFPVFSMVFP